MPELSEAIRKPTKFKGTPEMRAVAENECWNAFMEIVNDLDETSALELALFHTEWYMKVGHTNLGRFYAALATAHIKENAVKA